MSSLKFLITFLFFLFGFHVAALINFWYWKFWWLDIIMHFSGGFWLAAVCIWLIANYQFPISQENFKNKKLASFIIIFSFVALIGIFWEFFEFGLDLISPTKKYVWAMQQGAVDTISDLFFDLIGGAVAWLLLTHAPVPPRGGMVRGSVPRNTETE